MNTKQRLGDLLVQKGLVAQEQLKAALHAQVGGNRRLGYLLIKMGILSSDQLLETLSEQLGLPIVDVKGEFSPEVRGVLPRYLCRKYSVIPLRLKDNNMLSMAMVDPLDDEAIRDVENFTGMAVSPVLARQQDISAAIGKLLPFSLREVFNPQAYNRLAKVVSSVALALLVVVGGLLYHYVQTERYGRVSTVEGKKLYENHDLILGIEEGGGVSIFGHGAYAAGYYSVTFNDVDAFKNFVEQKRKSFSEKQHDWIIWVLSRNAM